MGAWGDDSKRWTRVFAVLVAASVAVRFVALEADPPWGLIGRSGEFLSDEGWYTKSGQLRARFGEWTSELDMVWFTHNALFSGVHAVVYSVFGVGVVTARAVSVVSFCVTLAAFFAVVSKVHSRPLALAACLAASVTLHAFGFSRMALVEPLGVALSMLAVAAWVLLPRGVAACGTGLVLAAAACFTKIAFVYVLTALVLLSIGEAVFLFRSGRRTHAGITAALVVAVPLAAWLLHDVVIAMEPEQGALFRSWHVQSRAEQIDLAQTAFRMAKSVYKATIGSGNGVLLAAIAVPGAIVLWRHRRRVLDLLPRTRGAIALTLWGVGGIAFFGLFKHQATRYLYFAAFPMAFWAVSAVAAVAPPGRRVLAVAGLVVAHAALQAPWYAAWLTRRDLFSADRAARSVVAHVTASAPTRPVVVMGDTSAFLSLYDERIRPIDLRWQDWLDKRFARWRPQFVFALRIHAAHVPELCGDLVERLEPVETYDIMEGYLGEGDFVLYRVVYR